MNTQNADNGRRWVDVESVVLRLLVLLLTTGLTWAAVAKEVQPVLVLLSGSGGGYLASRLFARLRASQRLKVWVLVYALHKNALWRWLAVAVEQLVFNTRTSAIVVALLGAGISGGAAALLAVMSGAPVSQAWASFVAFLASQVVYIVRYKPPSLAARSNLSASQDWRP